MVSVVSGAPPTFHDFVVVFTEPGLTADVSVIVTTYTERRWDCLVDALASLRRQTLAPREVIVVVDHNPKLLSRVRDEMGDPVMAEVRRQLQTMINEMAAERTPV